MILLLAAALITGTARAAVDLRVEARPVADPIEAFVTVTDANGDPVGGLTAADFTVTLDGKPITIQASGFSLPPSQDASQRVSIVFVMDYSGSIQSTALTAMQDAVIAFIDAMSNGDYAAIVKFNNTNPDKASVVQPFTEIDGAAGTSVLTGAVMAPYPGSGTNLLDAVNLAVTQFSATTVPLPEGPKAVIVISDGGENSSGVTAGTVTENANSGSIPVFAIGVGDVAGQDGLELLTSLATDTGGGYIPAPSDDEITAAYATIEELLSNEYLLTFKSAITDCREHTLEIAVAGQPVAGSATFTRCEAAPAAGGGGGGGGGALGLGELIVILGAFGIAFRRASLRCSRGR